jgi:hypothetical protein
LRGANQGEAENRFLNRYWNETSPMDGRGYAFFL